MVFKLPRLSVTIIFQAPVGPLDGKIRFVVRNTPDDSTSTEVSLGAVKAPGTLFASM